MMRQPPAFSPPYAGRMSFPEQLAALRRSKRFTLNTLASECGISVPQLHRYEAGTSQPTLDVIKKLAKVLCVSADALIFDPDERGPDDDLRLQFEAAKRLTPEEKSIAKALLESLLIRHEATQWSKINSLPLKPDAPTAPVNT